MDDKSLTEPKIEETTSKRNFQTNRKEEGTITFSRRTAKWEHMIACGKNGE